MDALWINKRRRPSHAAAELGEILDLPKEQANQPSTTLAQNQGNLHKATPAAKQQDQPPMPPEQPKTHESSAWSTYRDAWQTYSDAWNNFWQAQGQSARAGQIEGDGDYREAWRTHWKAQGQPWRTEAEIDKKRQVFLTKRRAIVPDIEQGIYPFKSIYLSRADIERLLDTQVDKHEGLDLRGALLSGINLSSPFFPQGTGLDEFLMVFNLEDPDEIDASGLPLTRMRGGLTIEQQLLYKLNPEQREMAAVHLEGASLMRAHLEGAILGGAHLEKARLGAAHLEGATLSEAFLEDADFLEAHLEGANLQVAHLKRSNFNNALMEGVNLQSAHLEEAFLDEASLVSALLGAAHLEGAQLGRADLAGAKMPLAHLEGAFLFETYFGGERLSTEDLARIRKWVKDFPEEVPPAYLRGAYFDSSTDFNKTLLGNEFSGSPFVADIRWHDANLANPMCKLFYPTQVHHR